MGKKLKVGKARKDKFYQLAKETGYRSRAAFKLIQLNRKFGFLQESQVCVDLCAAPGGWMQVAKQNMPVSSIVVGVDLYPIRPIPGCISLVEDITTEKCKQSLMKELQSWKVDVVLHDGAPNVGRSWLYDAYQQITLTLSALKLATQLLRSGGWFITKVFRSKDYNAMLWVMKQMFKKVHATKPSASRKESAEIFVVCQWYLAPVRIDPRLLDPKHVFEDLNLKPKSVSLLNPNIQKRIKAEGYSINDLALRNELTASEFMKSDNGLFALEGIGSLHIDDVNIAKHPRTTPEILECCKDIKVLGRKDVKGLLQWWKYIRKDLYNIDATEKMERINEATVTVRPSQGEMEDWEERELQEEIETLSKEEQKELKRKRKKTAKAKTKLNEKMNLNMIIKGDTGPQEQTEEEVFNLKSVETQRELDEMLDVAPDFDVEADKQIVCLKLPKYISFRKDDKRMDDDGNYVNDDEPELSMQEEDSDSDSDYENQGLGISDNDDANVGGTSKRNKKKRPDHPLIKSSDFRDKDTKRQHRVQLWFEKDNLQNIDDGADDDEYYDLNHLAEEYKRKGVAILGEESSLVDDAFITRKRAQRYECNKQKQNTDNSDECSSSDSDADGEEQDDEVIGYSVNSKAEYGKEIDAKAKVKKVRLSEEELALGAVMIGGRKARRDLIDGAYNRYTFNDEHLPYWFTQDEELHMKRPLPVPKELANEYERKVQELNVRPIKKVMEAKARKRRRALKRLAKTKKKAEKIMDNEDATVQEKSRQLKQIYSKLREKKKDITYVVAKKHQAGRRVRRPPGVKGRYRVVDPRMKKDKRSVEAKKNRNK